MTDAQISRYLQRINYANTTVVSLENLGKLQQNHLLHVPFENLDIHFGISIELDREKLYNKIIERNRGGFCYELNGLFYELLIHLGYHVDMVSARVFSEEKGYGPERDHMALIVHLTEGDFLVDVGFGEFTFQPLNVAMRAAQNDPRGVFRIEAHENYLIVYCIKNETIIPQYKLTLTPRILRDFTAICIYQQTHPDSHFIKKRVISRPTLNGRISLAGITIKITEDDVVRTEELSNEEAFHKALKDYFFTTI